MTLRFEPLARTDVPEALELSVQAGWGMRETDWNRMVDAPWIDTVGGWSGADLVATATVVTYGTDLAWIGSILVDESIRRRGYGTAVFEAAVDCTADHTTVGLDANDDGKPIYEAAGFVDVAAAEQWSGVLDPGGDPSSVSRTRDVDALAAIDRDACAVDRRPLLRSMLTDPGVTAYRKPGVGYALVSPTRTVPTIGPIVSETGADVTDLLAAVAADLDDEPVVVNTTTALQSDPDPSARGDDVGTADAAAPFRDAGLTYRRRLTRMVDGSGDEPLMGPSIRAITGFAYG